MKDNIISRTLGSVAKYINGRAFKPSEWEDIGLPIIRIQNLTDQDAPCNFSQLEFEEKFKVRKGDLLFAWSASLGAHIWRGNDAWLNQHIFKVEPHSETNKMYLFYFLKKIVADLYSKTHGSGMVHITKEPFMATLIPLPPLSEQERIVARIEELFSELDKGVEALQTIKAQLKVYRQAVLKEAFEGIDAKLTTLNEVIIAKPRNGYSPKPVNFPTNYKNLTLTATTGGKFIEGCCKYVELDIQNDSYLWVKHDDILIQRANTIDYVGTAAIYRGVDNVYVYPDLMMKVHTREGFDPLFILYQLQSGKTRSYFKANATGTSGSMPKINQATVMETPIVVVTYEKQLQIANLIESRLSVCDKIEQTVDESLTKAESLRQSILKKAFEGKL